jgi:glutathione synthase/RimK-type ligase-like ATP-grasp enzyme
MTWLVLVEAPADAEALATALPVAPTAEFIAHPRRAARAGPKILSFARSYAYQSEGYYVSLLAEARGLRVIPTVETILDLSSREGYSRALPELEHALNRDLARLGEPPPARLLVCFGQVESGRLTGFARLLFDWFRAPAVQATLRVGDGGWVSIARLALRPVHRMTAGERAFLASAMAAYTRRAWRPPKVRAPLRHSIAVLQDPKESLPPSSTATLRHWAREAAKKGVEIEPITRKDLPRLAEFDALFIRETTSIRNHTFRFARRAEAEGMPVIDDPRSIIRCTNKIYLWELLARAGLPTPETMLVRAETDLSEIADRLGLPVVLKVPDGSFSRGVVKAASLAELAALRDTFLTDGDLALAQRYIPTAYDWRIGVLGGGALFAVQYQMARGHWQIVKHRDGKPALEGGFAAVPLAAAPPDIVDIAVRSANLIGEGLYGVDLKETPDGPVVIEINDNPNLEHGVEDRAEKGAVWDRLTAWFLDRLNPR